MEELLALYKEYYSFSPDKAEKLPQSASTRSYFRIWKDGNTVIGTLSPDRAETRAFVNFSAHFLEKGISVPKVLAVSKDESCYLQEDLGDTLLLNMVDQYREGAVSREELVKVYKRVIEKLLDLQLEGGKGLDYSLSVPRPVFDRLSVAWDLNHFKYYFLKISALPFSEDLLEKDFNELTALLCEEDMKHFMFRDFQSRNILIHNGEPFFIDFQGGRKGPLQYDLASLLFEAKVHLETDIREELYSYYLDQAAGKLELDRVSFAERFYWWLLIRQLQALGAYGLRGIIEKKLLFIQSIPYALQQLEDNLNRLPAEPALPELRRVLMLLAAQKNSYPVLPEAYDGLTITVTSFSFRKALPDDLSGNGGGFVYDCRFIRNPGRYESYAKLTGNDPAVEAFFLERTKMPRFLEQVRTQLTDVVASYQERGYANLMLNFGCTGGQHRSVYAARKTAAWLEKKEGVRVILRHRELEAGK